MPPEQAGDGRPRRVRARKACEPCRERKRRCDGNSPCGPCARFEYVCQYVSVRERRAMSQYVPTPVSAAPSASVIRPNTGADNQLQSREANSGAAFVRKLALALDPASAPRLQLFAWNLFLGARTVPGYYPRVRSVVDIISQAGMESLATIYLDKVDPCYGFIDHSVLRQRTRSRWSPGSLATAYDAVLCGIAALAFLFSRTQVESAELDCAETAKTILEQSKDSEPNIDIVTGLVLRVAYLRMTAPPHTAWLSSCAMMHTIEASGIHLEHASQPRNIPGLPQQDVASDLRRRVAGIACHLNLWMSFDLGRSRVVLPHADCTIPPARSRDYTVEILNLLPPSRSLDPEKDQDLSGLKTILRDVLKSEHIEPPSILAQCNLVLLVLRRLRALDFTLSGNLLDEVLGLTSRAVRSAQAMLNSGSPWHHVANGPFQIICILLAIDTSSSIAQVADAVKVLSNAVQLHNTDAAQEALNTACLLVLLHQKRKDMDAKNLAKVLRTYSPSQLGDTMQIAGYSAYESGTEMDELGDYPTWLHELMTDFPDLQSFDAGQLLDEGSLQNLSAGLL